MPILTLQAETRDITVPGLKKPLAYRFVDVLVYDTAAEFATAYDAHTNEPAGTGATVGACFHQAEVEDQIDGFLGQLWFTRETLSRDDIIHEAVHVAIYSAQMHFGARKYRPLKLPTDDDKQWREEAIAYIAAPLADHLITTLLDAPQQELADAAA